MANKPITVARQDFMEGLVKLCNESGLPAFAMADILSQLMDVIHSRIDEEYKRDKEAYLQALQEEEIQAKRDKIMKRTEPQQCEVTMDNG